MSARNLWIHGSRAHLSEEEVKWLGAKRNEMHSIVSETELVYERDKVSFHRLAQSQRTNINHNQMGNFNVKQNLHQQVYAGTEHTR